MAKKISRDTPLAELTLRRYEKPSLKGRPLVRKLCLSLGLLQPGDSRDVVVDVLMVLIATSKKKKNMNSDEIVDAVKALRKKKKLPMQGVAASNVRRQIRRLRELFLIEKVTGKNLYRITEFDKFETIFTEKIETYFLPSLLTRVKEYMKAVDKERKK